MTTQTPLVISGIRRLARRAGDQGAEHIAGAHVLDLGRRVQVLAARGHQGRQRHGLRHQRQERNGQDLRHHRNDEARVDLIQRQSGQQVQGPARVHRDVEQPAAGDQILPVLAQHRDHHVEGQHQQQRGHRQGPGALEPGHRDQQEHRAGNENQQTGQGVLVTDDLPEPGNGRVDHDADARFQQQPADTGHEAADHRIGHQLQQAGKPKMTDHPEKRGDGQGGQRHHGQHRRQPGRAGSPLAHVHDQQAGDGGQDDHRLLVQADDVQALFGGQCDEHAQHGPAAQEDHHQQRQELRQGTGEYDRREGVAPKRVVQPVENAERDVREQGFGAITGCSDFYHCA
jgi:hypothetical protein